MRNLSDHSCTLRRLGNSIQQKTRHDRNKQVSSKATNLADVFAHSTTSVLLKNVILLFSTDGMDTMEVLWFEKNIFPVLAGSHQDRLFAVHSTRWWSQIKTAASVFKHFVPMVLRCDLRFFLQCGRVCQSTLSQAVPNTTHWSLSNRSGKRPDSHWRCVYSPDCRCAPNCHCKAMIVVVMTVGICCVYSWVPTSALAKVWQLVLVCDWENALCCRMPLCMTTVAHFTVSLAGIR